MSIDDDWRNASHVDTSDVLNRCPRSCWSTRLSMCRSCDKSNREIPVRHGGYHQCMWDCALTMPCACGGRIQKLHLSSFVNATWNWSYRCRPLAVSWNSAADLKCCCLSGFSTSVVPARLHCTSTYRVTVILLFKNHTRME